MSKSITRSLRLRSGSIVRRRRGEIKDSDGTRILAN
jgi:hypothetical protein